MPWEVEFHPECEGWARSLSSEDRQGLLAATRTRNGSAERVAELEHES